MPYRNPYARPMLSSLAALAACAGTATNHAAVTRAAAARTVTAQALPTLDGSHLVTTLVEVRYPPGGHSAAHRHPCAVVGFVIEGALRSQVAGRAEAVYPAGASFYEAPNSVHVISANASATAPVRFLAWFTCDRAVPLSMPADTSSPHSSFRQEQP